MTSSEPRSLATLTREGYTTPGVFAYISAGIRLLTENFALLIAFAALLVAISTVANLVPVVGPIALLLVVSPLYAGLYIFLLKRLQGETAAFNDFFTGFNCFGPVVLAAIVTAIFIIAGFLFCLLPGIYLAISYTFTFPLIVEHRLDFWGAMETSRKIIGHRWFVFFCLGLIYGLVSLVVVCTLLFAAIPAGIVADITDLSQGLPLPFDLAISTITTLVTIAAYCSTAVAYHDIVGPRSRLAVQDTLGEPEM